MATEKRIFANACSPRIELFEDFCKDILSKYLVTQSGRGLDLDVQKQWEGALVWVVSALYESHHVGAKSVILPMGKKNFPIFGFGYQSTLSSLNILKSTGWVEVRVAKQGLYVNRASEIFALKKLQKLFKRTGLVWTSSQYDDNKEVVIVRERDDFLNERLTLPTPETSEVWEMRKEIHEINRRTSKLVICPYLPDAPLRRLIRGEGKEFCNLSDLSYRRIFAMGRLDRGGRFYGGWWQNIRRGLRPNIRINDEPTIELDFGSTVVTLIYAQMNLALPMDSYELGINPDRNIEKRDVIKKYIAALLNTRSKYGLPKEKLEFLGVTQKALRQLVEEKHHQIKHVFETGVGLELMFIESKITRLILLELLKQNVPVLGIHDGFVCQARHERLLNEAMNECFYKVTGVHPTIKPANNGLKIRRGRHRVYDLFMSLARRSGVMAANLSLAPPICRG